MRRETGKGVAGAQMRVPERPRVVGDPSMRVGSLYGNREISRLTAANERFYVKHPRWEPGARIGLAGICAGGAQ